MGIIRDISEIVNAIEKDAATYFFGNDNMKSTGIRMASNVRMNQPMATPMPRRSPTQAPVAQTNASKPQVRTGVSLRGTTPVRQLHGTTPARQLYGTSPVKAGRGRLRLTGTSPIKLAQAAAIRQDTEKTAQTWGYYAPAHDPNAAKVQMDFSGKLADKATGAIDTASRVAWGGLGTLAGLAKYKLDAIGNIPRIFGSEKNWWGDDFRDNSIGDYLAGGFNAGYDHAGTMASNALNGMTFGLSDTLGGAADMASAESEKQMNGNKEIGADGKVKTVSGDDAMQLFQLRDYVKNTKDITPEQAYDFAKANFGDNADGLMQRLVDGDDGLSGNTKWMSTSANIAGQVGASAVGAKALGAAGRGLQAAGKGMVGGSKATTIAGNTLNVAGKALPWTAATPAVVSGGKDVYEKAKDAYGKYEQNRELDAQIKRQKEINALNQQQPSGGFNWQDFIAPAGGGILAYLLARSMFGGGGDEGEGRDRDAEGGKNSTWNNLIREMLALGAGAAGAYGGYRLNRYVNGG